jgi:hypothetical protein
MRLVVVGKLLFGAVPCVAASALSFLAISNLIEQFVVPSEIFGRPAFTGGHAFLLGWFICGAIGGLAGVAAWFKEWKGVREPNGYLVGGLVMAFIALAVANVAILSARDFVWLYLVVPPVVVTPIFLFQEIRAFKR